MNNICPSCGFQHLRHKGKKIPSVTGGIKYVDLKVKQEWTQKGYECKRCGWESFE